MNEQLTSIISVFGTDTTLRWSCRAGDFLIWFRWKNILADPEHGVTIPDMWEMRTGDFATITNRAADLPSWFELHPTEVCNSLVPPMMEKLKRGWKPGDIVDGPNLWRLRAGDRMAWVGDPRRSMCNHGHVLAVVDFQESALVVGETNRTMTMEDAVLFGSLTVQQNQNRRRTGSTLRRSKRTSVKPTGCIQGDITLSGNGLS